MTSLTTTQVAERLGIDPSRVRRLSTTYGIGVAVNSRLRLYSEADVDLLRQRSTGKAGRPRKSSA